VDTESRGIKMQDLFGWNENKASFKGKDAFKIKGKPKRAIRIKGEQKANHNPNRADCIGWLDKKTGQWIFKGDSNGN